eukprot:TRINITY_DN4512_c0_g1_i1.p1 TRINITY_DN4512_c0_g1~~TRINITY_DN4512_c0_g1_i1.p1  ORF type:complete len:269 (-),score=21.26 TRINITY_DN4512_c0_g1_i1:196-1002(-)
MSKTDEQILQSVRLSQSVPIFSEWVSIRNVESRHNTGLEVGFLDKHLESYRVSGRGELVWWLLKLAEFYSLPSEVVYLTVNYFDRILLKMQLTPPEAQTVALVSLIIASKVWLPKGLPSRTAAKCLGGDSTTTSLLIKTEYQILTELNWSVVVPPPHIFVPYILKHVDVPRSDTLFTYLSAYLTFSSVDPTVSTYRPSKIAGLAAYLSARKARVPFSGEVLSSVLEISLEDFNMSVQHFDQTITPLLALKIPFKNAETHTFGDNAVYA